MLTNYLIVYFAVVNATAYFLMGYDKKQAQRNQWRVAEKTLFLLCFIGGFVGIYLAMKHFRHKTQHLSFKIAVWLALLLWLSLIFTALHYFARL